MIIKIHTYKKNEKSLKIRIIYKYQPLEINRTKLVTVQFTYVHTRAALNFIPEVIHNGNKVFMKSYFGLLTFARQSVNEIN